MIEYREALDTDLKQIIKFVKNLKVLPDSYVINFGAMDIMDKYEDEEVFNQLTNPRYIRSIVFDYNTKVVLASEQNAIVAMYVLFGSPSITTTTTIDLLFYYSTKDIYPLNKNVVQKVFPGGYYTKFKITLNQSLDDIASKIGFNKKETITYLAGKDYIFSINLVGER